MHGKIKRARASDVMSGSVITLKEGTSLADLVKVMNDKGVGSVVVVNDAEAPTGIITERDIIKTLAEQGRAFFDLTAGGIMSKPLTTIIPSTDIDKVEKEMKRRKIKHLPVVSGGRVVGIVSSRDIVDYLGKWQVHE